MGPSRAVRVEYAVAIDHLMVFVFQKWKVELPVEPFAEHLAEFFGVFTTVDADRQYLDFLFLLFCQKAFQLPELLYAERSPIAAVKN